MDGFQAWSGGSVAHIPPVWSSSLASLLTTPASPCLHAKGKPVAPHRVVGLLQVHLCQLKCQPALAPTSAAAWAQAHHIAALVIAAEGALQAWRQREEDHQELEGRPCRGSRKHGRRARGLEFLVVVWRLFGRHRLRRQEVEAERAITIDSFPAGM